MSISPELRRQLLTLSADEREQLANELYESIVSESSDPAWEHDWTIELEQRVQSMLDRSVELIDAEDVHRDLRTSLRASQE